MKTHDCAIILTTRTPRSFGIYQIYSILTSRWIIVDAFEYLCFACPGAVFGAALSVPGMGRRKGRYSPSIDLFTGTAPHRGYVLSVPALWWQASTCECLKASDISYIASCLAEPFLVQKDAQPEFITSLGGSLDRYSVYEA